MKSMKQIRTFKAINSALANRMQGGTLLGFMLGLVIGLGVAVVVAIFVTRAPVPFMNKTNKASERVLEGRANTDIPDPNKGMYGKQRTQEAHPEVPRHRQTTLRPGRHPSLCQPLHLRLVPMLVLLQALLQD
jgi:hypothetical protein